MATPIRALALGAALTAVAASSAMAQGYNGTWYDRNRTYPPGAEYHPYASGQPYGVSNYYQPGRTYSGSAQTGFPPSGTPSYPGPRLTGSKGGGTGGGS